MERKIGVSNKMEPCNNNERCGVPTVWIRKEVAVLTALGARYLTGKEVEKVGSYFEPSTGVLLEAVKEAL